MLLSEITESHHNHGGHDLCNRGVYMELFDEQFYKKIIQRDADGDQQEVPEQLYFAVKGGFRKHNVSHQKKSQWETYRKRKNECSDMRFKGDKTQVQRLFVEDIIVAYKVEENIQKGIQTATGCVPECLFRHEPAERGIKKINKRNNPPFQHLFITI
jgi:hypothetical protein